jgi:NAD(P)-dependent dehydrogenase (short-subunit alcohol dehydrogenase family)
LVKHDEPPLMTMESSSPDKPLVLITGAGGNLGSSIGSALAGEYGPRC